jgi:rod shape-determining protein MreC
MENLLTRHRNLSVLAAVLFIQVFGLAVQVRSKDPEHPPLIRVWAVATVTPFEQAIVHAEGAVYGVWHNYLYLRGVRQENRVLKAQIEQLRLDQVRLNQDASQARRLQALLGFKEQSILATLPAQVVGSSGSEQSRSLYLDKGERDGLRKGMAVITADGVVGKVLQVYPHTAQVLLINDQSSGLGAIVERLRAQGIVRGSPAGETLLEKIMADEEVQPGDRIITTGGDGIFPKGLLVGTVIKVSPSDLFLRIRLHPAADLTRLEEVLVITKMQDVPPPGDVAASQRAADILAERLPGVPDKPASPDATHPDTLGAAAADAATPKSAADAATPKSAAVGATPKSAAVGATPKSPVTGAKLTPPHAAAKPAGPEPPPQRSPGPQAKPTHDPKLPPDLKPISQRMQ